MRPRNRRIMGPVVLITIGTLFWLHQMYGWWDFGRTWPVILIVIGVVLLVERLGMDGGYDYGPPPPNNPPPTYTVPPQNPPGTASGSESGDRSNVP